MPIDVFGQLPLLCMIIIAVIVLIYALKGMR